MYETACRPTGFLLCSLLLFASLAGAQGEPLRDAREREIIAEIRGGTWKLGRVEILVKRLISRGNTHAARWWSAHAVEAAENGSLPRDTKKKLAILHKQAGLTPVEPQLRKMPARAVRHLKKLNAQKCWSAIPGAVRFARRCLELYPDKKMGATVDAIEASLERADRKAERPFSKGLQKVSGKLIEDLAKARDELLADMVSQYESYPCPPGARAIRALILARGEKAVTPEWRAAWDRVCDTEYKLEPKMKVRLWIENGGKVQAWRYGKRLVGTHGRSYFGERKQGVVFEAVPGDVLQFEISKLHAKKGKRKLFVVAATAEVDDKLLGAEAWTHNMNEKPSSLEPLINPVCHGIAFGPGLKMPGDVLPEVIEQAEMLGEGILIPTVSEFHHYAVNMHKKLVAARAAFDGHGKSYHWLAAEGDRLVLVLKIPR